MGLPPDPAACYVPVQMSSRAQESPRSFDTNTHALMAKTIKGLAMDAVEQAQSGHPGMPMGMADAASVLWTRFLVHDPSTPSWPDRDRFVLSAGHGSMLLYSLLHLTGYAVGLDDLRNFRQLGSATPGHPELGDTPGVEVTTGPLGTGFAAGVGMALAERFLADRYNRPGFELFDHFTYGIVSDGDMMEGIGQEAASLAGHLGLGKLIYLYDDNSITIDGSTDLSFTEDVAARCGAQGWHVVSVDGHDPAAVADAIVKAKAVGDRPSLVVCRTTIAHGAPNAAGTSKSHGSPLGTDEIDATKAAMGWPTDRQFHVPGEVRAALDDQAEELQRRRIAWEDALARYQGSHPQLSAELEALLAGGHPPGAIASVEAIEQLAPGTKLATRKAVAKVLRALVEAHPTVLGGSADLATSNGVEMPDVGSQSREAPGGRNLHFGVREHAMAGVCNGLALHGAVQPFDATFLVFSDFMRGALRLGALMRLPVIHVFSHDSVLLGEDGPTHQPIEHLMSLRAIPRLHVVRPADAEETVGAWLHALGRRRGDGPTAIVVTRQGVPVLQGTRRDISKGAYVVWQPAGVAASDLHGVLIATGSEVHIAVAAAEALGREGTPVRVVSMPCWEAFEAQDTSYRDDVLPPRVQRRLSIEAGTGLGWTRYAAHHHGLEDFGASAPAAALTEHFGLTADAIADHYRRLD